MSSRSEVPLIEADGLHAGYDNIVVLTDISLSLTEGEIAAVIGPNGAGKTTLMNALMGLIPASNGTIRYRGEDITTLATHERISRGISLVPEERFLFPNMTVRENLTLGAYSNRRDDSEPPYDRIFSLFPRLEERSGQKAKTLSGGEAQMLTIGRSLMSDPDLLLLDEPSQGLAPNLLDEVFEKVAEVNAEGVSVMLVEQVVEKSLELADRGYLIENGRIDLSGDSSEMLNDELVVENYLGGPS